MAPWQPPHIATLMFPCFPAKLQAQIFLETSGSLAQHPVRPSWSWQPSITVSKNQKNHWAQSGHTGCPSSLAGTVQWHMEAQAVLTTPPSVVCLCQSLLPEGSFQESAASPVPGWFYTPRGQDNVRKSPERGMWPEVLGQRGLRPEMSYSRSESTDNSEGRGCL